MTVNATFGEIEASKNLSRPVTLYRFDLGAEIFRFCDQTEDYVFQGTTYTAIQIKHTQPTVNPGEPRNTKVTIEAAFNVRPFSDFLDILPSNVLDVQISRIQRDETPDSYSPRTGPASSPEPAPVPSTQFIIFEGYVSGSDFTERTCKFQCTPGNDRLNREIPRFKYQGLCNHVLFDNNCKVDANSYRFISTVAGIVGNEGTGVKTLVVQGLTGSAYAGGYFQIGNEVRAIYTHSGDTITILLPLLANPLGQSITMFQGCNRSAAQCRDKFSNIINFGGFPYVPTLNPFEKAQFMKGGG